MTDRKSTSDYEELGWGWSRANVIACAVLGAAVLGLIIWQWTGRGHYLGADIKVEPELVEQARARLDPNTASAAELMSIPGIGPALADRIVGYRQQFTAEHGESARAFERLDDLQKVRGIGPKTAEKMQPYLEFAAGTEDGP